MKALLALIAGVFAVLPLYSRAACPPAPTIAVLQQLDSVEERLAYTHLRWFKCGWSEAGPLITTLLQSQPVPMPDAAEDESDHQEALMAVFMFISANPDALWAEFKEALELDDSDLPRQMRDLVRYPVSDAQAVKNFEQGLGPAVQLLQEQPSLAPELKLHMELALIAQQVRLGHLDQARARLERAAQDLRDNPPPAQNDSPVDEVQERLGELRALLAQPEAYSAAAVEPLAPLYLSRRPWRGCGFGEAMEATFGFEYLRPYVLRGVDTDTAIADLLHREWELLVHSNGRHTDLLVELLRKRYSETQLRQEWDDALAGLRLDDKSAGLNLFGHWLPLPREVIEYDEAGGPDTERRRPVQREELVELVRKMDLYITLNPAAAPAKSGS